MKHLALLLLVVACPLASRAAPPVASPPPAAAAKPAPPQIPAVLEPLKARISNGDHVLPGLGPILNLTAHEPLTDEQWKALEEFGMRSFQLSGKGFGDAAMPRLAKLDPTALFCWEMPMTDAGAEHLASMKSLRAALWVHAGGGITTKTAHTLESHPAIEYLVMPISWFVDLPTFTRIVQSCKKLRAMAWGHFGGDDYCKALEHHPAIEDLWCWPDFVPGGITDAGATSLTTLKKLKKLKLEFSRVTYDGSLKLLENCPDLESLTLTNMAISDEDLARLKADLPKVKIMFTPLEGEKLAAFLRGEAKRDMPEVLKAANAQLGRDPLDATGTLLSLSGTAALTPEQWAAIEPLRTKLGIRAFGLSGKAGDDAAIARLAAFDPTMLVLNGCAATDAGLAHLAGMKSLRGLHLANCGGITPAAASVVVNHPTIDNLVLPPKWLGDPATFTAVLANPKLRVLAVSQQQAGDATCALLARHPGIEELSLSAHGTAGLTNAGLASLATLPKLAKLSLGSCRLTWTGGLEHLAKLPGLTTLALSNVIASQEDIDRLKAALPKTTQVTFTPMPPAAVAAFEKLEAAGASK